MRTPASHRASMMPAGRTRAQEMGPHITAPRNAPAKAEQGLPWLRPSVSYVVVGFLAHLVDGALVMAYGVISATFLLSAGMAPALARVSVHAAEMVTTTAAGFSHLR